MTITADAPVDTDTLLPAKRVDLRRATHLGFWAGVTTVFVAAVGMVENFSERDLLGGLSLGETLLLAIPFIAGIVAGQTPSHVQGFKRTLPGPRNVIAGLLAGLVTAAVLGAFVTLILNVDIRDPFINVTPALASEADGPKLLLWGHSPGLGLLLVAVLSMAIAAAGGAFFLLSDYWRRAALTGVLTVVAVALLQPFNSQILRGTQEELQILTSPLTDFLYSGRALRIPAALVIGLAAVATYAVMKRPDRVPLQTRINSLPSRPRRAAHGSELIVFLVVLAILPPILGPGLSQTFVRAGIFILMALGLNIVLGFGGMLDLGYVAFFAVGAYTTAILTSPTDGLAWGWSFWQALPIVIVACALAGLFVATPVVRMRGDYLAIVTLGFGEIVRKIVNSDWQKDTFGGSQGLKRLPDIQLPKVDIPSTTIARLETPDTLGGAIEGPQAFLYAVIVLIALATYVSFALQRSRIGRAWMALREDESVAEAMGVNIVQAKLSAFVIGAILAGFGGALFAANVGSVFPPTFAVETSIVILVTVIVGGMASVPGVMLGALVLVAGPELLREFDEYRLLIYGALLIFIMLRRPEGLIPSKRRAQELHEEDVAQDEWLRAEVAGTTSDDGTGS